MSRVLIALAIVAAVLALTKPWDTGRSRDIGPKADLIRLIETRAAGNGFPDQLVDCVTGDIDDEFTDAEAVALSKASASTLTLREAFAEPGFQKVGLIVAGCAQQMVANGEYSPQEAIAAMAAR
jgi:hypothetical protein